MPVSRSPLRAACGEPLSERGRPEGRMSSSPQLARVAVDAASSRRLDRRSSARAQSPEHLRHGLLGSIDPGPRLLMPACGTAMAGDRLRGLRAASRRASTARDLLVGEARARLRGFVAAPAAQVASSRTMVPSLSAIRVGAESLLESGSERPRRWRCSARCLVVGTWFRGESAVESWGHAP